jgi:hypothetical protein
MGENLHMVLEVARHDPALVLGFLLVALYAALFIHIELKMREAGYKPNPFTHAIEYHGLPLEYLRIRQKYGWSPWPAYLTWPCLVTGCVLVILGVVWLPN